MRGTTQRLAMAALLGAGLASAAPAHADDRWQEAAGGATAILPVPTRASGIVGGSLSCAHQQWTLILRTAPAAPGLEATEPGKVSVGADAFEAQASVGGGTIRLQIGKAALDPLRRGSRMSVAVGRDAPLKADFSLAGSRAVLDAIQPRCSPVDMAPYRAVSLSAADTDVAAAAALLDEEIKLFRAFTGKEPVVSAVLVPLDEGRRLLFASLCGSSAYYGRSGCTLRGFAAGGEGAQWAEVYNTEGLVLYLHPDKARDGWPDLATLPGGSDEPSYWVWNADAYRLAGPDGLPLQAAAEPDTAQQ